MSELLLDDKWQNEKTLKNLDVCIARFSGLNAPEDYEFKSQCLKGIKTLPHYQFIPAVLNSYAEPWQDIEEVQGLIEDEELFVSHLLLQLVITLVISKSSKDFRRILNLIRKHWTATVKFTYVLTTCSC